MPNNVMPTAAFRDSMRRDIIFADMAGCARVESGDPGAYDPFTGADLSHRVSFSHNKMHRPFGSLSSRELQLLSPGVGVPGPGSYRVGEAKMALIAEINDNRSSLLASSLSAWCFCYSGAFACGLWTHRPLARRVKSVISGLTIAMLLPGRFGGTVLAMSARPGCAIYAYTLP
jgi:hypothetical protein